MGQDHQSLTDREYQRGYPMTGKQRDSRSVSEECTGIRLIGNWFLHSGHPLGQPQCTRTESEAAKTQGLTMSTAEMVTVEMTAKCFHRH